ncbi:MAG: DNA-binding protein [Burkholderiales bacterium]|nr:DNA-binding protein [Burkholderiales bacterium]
MEHQDADPTLERPRGTLPVDPLQARVDAAAFALLREGRNPTVSLVRERMGGASPNSVAPALQRWRLSFAAQLGENASSALEVLPPAVLELVQALWSRALFEAHRVRADARSTADALEQLDEAIKALHERTARLDAREAALDEEQHALDQLRRNLEAATTVPRERSSTRTTASAPRRRKQPGGAPRKSTQKRKTVKPRRETPRPPLRPSSRTSRSGSRRRR